MRTFETSATIENQSSLHLDTPLEESISGRVHVLIFTDDEDISEMEWMQAAAHNRVYDFLKDPEEDIYTLEDGIPWNDGDKK